MAVVAAASCSAERAESISAQELAEHVTFLASDELAGRATGTPGIAEAERYIAAAFREMGLSPLPDHSTYFVDFTLFATSYDAQTTQLNVSTRGTEINARVGTDFLPFWFSGLGTVQTEIVFAGYGITAPEHNYDDYEGLDVEGKVVLVLRHEPNERDPDSPFDGVELSRHALFKTKAENAVSHGAVGMLLFTDPLNHNRPDDLSNRAAYSLDRADATDRHAARRMDGFYALHISRTIAHRLFSAWGTDAATVQRAVDSGTTPDRIDTGTASVRVSVRMTGVPESVAARNVVGYVPGNDPALSDQVIIVGAHHDHLGAYEGTGDTIFNGADDNASGTAVVVEIAEQLMSEGASLRRSVIFVTFSAEEIGLLGSTALMGQGAVDLNTVAFMLNFDMVGRNPDDPLEIHGDGFAPGMRHVVAGLNESFEIPLDFAGREYEPSSDTHVFYKNNIPFLMFYTGAHADYHGTGDHADKLAYGRMERIARLGYELLRYLGDADSLPAFN